jgi:hypothetical protein
MSFSAHLSDHAVLDILYYIYCIYYYYFCVFIYYSMIFPNDSLVSYCSFGV